MSFKSFPEAFLKKIILLNSSWWLLPYMASVALGIYRTLGLEVFASRKFCTFCEFLIDWQKFMKVKVLSWLIREYLFSRVFIWSQKFSEWGQKVLNWELTLFANVYVHEMLKFRDFLISQRMLVAKVSDLVEVQERFK